MAKKAQWTLLLFAVWLLASACQSPRVHRLTDFEYTPKPSSAAIELFTEQIGDPYTLIAIVDSRRYALRDYDPEATEDAAIALHKASESQHTAMLGQMRQDLMELARKLGGDAVHKMRLLSTRERGMVRDPAAPIPGVRQSEYSKRYFYRGELIKYIETKNNITPIEQKKDNEL